MKWPEVQEGRRRRTLLKWRYIIEENLGSSDVGIKLHQAALDLHDEAYLQQIVTDSFAFKKTSTLDKRGNSLLRYLKWHRKEYGCAGTPIDEARVYEFLVKEHSRLSATFPTSLSAAMNFSHFVIGLKGARKCAESARIRGRVFSKAVQKKILKQRRILKVHEAAVLELGVRAQLSVYDRVASGFFACQLHTRSRFTSLQFADGLIMDFEGFEGFVEIETRADKNQNTANQMTMYMPYVAPIRGVSKSQWCKEWIALLRDEKLAVIDPENSRRLKFTNGFILPMPGLDGNWSSMPVEVGEATRWLQGLLNSMGVSDFKDVGTHSLKHTPLSWSAKFEAPDDIQCMLGHHSQGPNKTHLVYSRDAQARPLRFYSKMLHAIRSGTFDPDLTRSGRVFKRPSTVLGASKDVQNVDAGPPPESDDIEEEHSEADQSSGSSSSDESDSDVREAVAQVSVRTGLNEHDFEEARTQGKFYVHTFSKLLHLLPHNSLNKLNCSVKISRFFAKVSPRDACSLMPCKNCFTKFRKMSASTDKL